MEAIRRLATIQTLFCLLLHTQADGDHFYPSAHSVAHVATKQEKPRDQRVINKTISADDGDRDVKKARAPDDRLADWMEKVITKLDNLEKAVAKSVPHNFVNELHEINEKLTTIDSFIQTHQATWNETRDDSDVQSDLNRLLYEISTAVEKFKAQIEGSIPDPRDCAEIHMEVNDTSGVYEIRPLRRGKKLKVSCDMTTDGGGWTVFQRRGGPHPTIDFNRGWKEYEYGFGNIEEEFWLGLENLHVLASEGLETELRIEMEDTNGKIRFAQYSGFSVGGEETKYYLSIDTYTGDAGNFLEDHDGASFSTRDRNNGRSKYVPCSLSTKSGWWYRGTVCETVNPNGIFLPWDLEENDYGVKVDVWKERYPHSLKMTEMKLRPAEFVQGLAHYPRGFLMGSGDKGKVEKGGRGYRKLFHKSAQMGKEVRGKSKGGDKG